MIISINGEIIKKQDAKIPVTSKAFLYGFSVFETIRTYNKKVFRLDDHLARLYVSADIIGFEPKWNFKKAYEAVVKTMEASKRWPETKIRVILMKESLIVMIEKMQEKPKEVYKKGVKVVSFHGKRNLPHAKALSDAFTYVAKQHALSCGAYESLLVDPKSYVRECAYANVFWVNNGVLHTTNKQVLFGITRETVIELAEFCEFKGVKYKALRQADEVFITQTTSGIVPVVEIDGQKIGNGKPGPVTKKIMKKFDKLVWGKVKH